MLICYQDTIKDVIKSLEYYSTKSWKTSCNPLRKWRNTVFGLQGACTNSVWNRIGIRRNFWWKCPSMSSLKQPGANGTGLHPDLHLFPIRLWEEMIQSEKKRKYEKLSQTQYLQGFEDFWRDRKRYGKSTIRLPRHYTCRQADFLIKSVSPEQVKSNLLLIYYFYKNSDWASIRLKSCKTTAFLWFWINYYMRRRFRKKLIKMWDNFD